MDAATLDKLKKNPFYKMSGKQKEEAAKIERPMVEFGVPPIQNSTPVIHPTLERKKKK